MSVKSKSCQKLAVEEVVFPPMSQLSPGHLSVCCHLLKSDFLHFLVISPAFKHQCHDFHLS